MSSPLPAVAVAECIAFLEILHGTTPTLPCANLRPASLDHGDDRYQLPFDKERDLTGTLAFLSNIKNNPNRIPAVCIREDQQQNMLQLFVAVNQEKSNDGAHVLKETQMAFGKLLQTIGASHEGTCPERLPRAKVTKEVRADRLLSQNRRDDFQRDRIDVLSTHP
jgi:hypothetical protein